MGRNIIDVIERDVEVGPCVIGRVRRGAHIQHMRDVFRYLLWKAGEVEVRQDFEFCVCGV